MSKRLQKRKKKKRKCLFGSEFELQHDHKVVCAARLIIDYRSEQTPLQRWSRKRGQWSSSPAFCNLQRSTLWGKPAQETDPEGFQGFQKCYFIVIYNNRLLKTCHFLSASLFFFFLKWGLISFSCFPGLSCHFSSLKEWRSFPKAISTFLHSRKTN